ncbi:MAG TPA: DUF4215 domain-containing protein, partial [Polyangiaceae bacterium]|nr:DUF4215 domain-containing protein [Polyangiaceae bacterium]
WTGATMTSPVGSAATVVQEAAGWGLHRARLDSFAGENTEVKFHLDSDNSNQPAGLAIDDVVVTACRYECGDGELYNAGLGGTEECDDGNTDNGDGCSDTCQDETSLGDGGSDAGTDAGSDSGAPNDASASGGAPNDEDAATAGGAPSNDEDAAAGANASGGSPFGGGGRAGATSMGPDAGVTPAAAAGDDGGCGCKVPATRSQSPWQSMLLVALTLSLAARRRRR